MLKTNIVIIFTFIVLMQPFYVIANESSTSEIPAVIINSEDNSGNGNDNNNGNNSNGNGEAEINHDPLEPVNRGIFRFNDVLDDAVIKPVARGYRDIVPEQGREMISNATSNLSSPVTFANNALQGDIGGALATFWRFVINSTVGIGGVFDVAKQVGLEAKGREDFGQTLGTYGAENGGSYIVLPILGPSNARDAVGLVVDTLTNPFNYLGMWPVTGWHTVDAINKREELLDVTDEIDRTSLDPYATTRSAYIQHRNGEIKNEAK